MDLLNSPKEAIISKKNLFRGDYWCQETIIQTGYDCLATCFDQRTRSGEHQSPGIRSLSNRVAEKANENPEEVFCRLGLNNQLF